MRSPDAIASGESKHFQCFDWFLVSELCILQNEGRFRRSGPHPVKKVFRCVKHPKKGKSLQVCHCQPVPQHWCGNPFPWHSHYRALPPAAPFALALAQRKWGKRKAAFLRVSVPGNHRTILRDEGFLVPGKDLTVVLSPRPRWFWPERGAQHHRPSSNCFPLMSMLL